MDQPQPIRTELFRFVSLKAANRISTTRKKLGFIEHPHPAQSFFLKHVEQMELPNARKTIQEIKNQYTPLKTYSQIVEHAPALYELSYWLNEHLGELNLPRVKQRIQGLPKLNKNQQIRLWDELFYQLLDKSNPTLRQACIQLIVANNFISECRTGVRQRAIETIKTPRKPEPPTEDECVQRYLQRLAKAKVLVPKSFSVARQRKVTPRGFGGYRPKNEMMGELMNLGGLFFAETKLKKMKQVKMDIKRNKKAIGEAKGEGNIVRPSKFRSGELNAETMKFFKSSVKNGASEDGINRKIDAEIKKLNDDIVKHKSGKRKVKFYHGSKRKKDALKPHCYMVAFDNTQTVEIGLMFKLNVGEKINGISTKFQYAGKTYQSQTFKSENKREAFEFLNLFPDKIIEREKTDDFELKINIELKPSDFKDIEISGSIEEKQFVGCANKPLVSTDEDSVDSSGISKLLFGVNRLGMGVYRRVEQEVCCYLPGEVSRIENVMAREYKERHTRNLSRTETSEETTEEVEVETQTDTATSARNEMNSEIGNVLAQTTSFNIGANMGASYNTGTTNVYGGGNFGFASSNSASTSIQEAQSFAQEVVQNTLDRVVQKVSAKRTNKIIQEFEENNRHGFDNRGGDKHVSGVYRWVDIIYKNRIVNYGKRLMVEFLIPEPAALYKWALDQKLEEVETTEVGNTLEEPISLSENGINSYEDITRDNYEDYGRLYGLTNLPAPLIQDDFKEYTRNLDEFDDPTVTKAIKPSKQSYRIELNVTPQYYLKEVNIKTDFDYHLKGPGELGTYFELSMGDYTIDIDKDKGGLQRTGSGNPLSYPTIDEFHEFAGIIKDKLIIEVNTKNIHDFSIILDVREEPDLEAEKQWKQDIYYALSDAYDAQKKEYDEAENQVLTESKESEKEKVETNPQFNRMIEQRELQRITIEMMMDPFFNAHGREVGENHMTSGRCGEPILNQSEEWEAYSSHVKFFEQAFDWSIMDYLFYPYYWAERCDWAELLQTKDLADPTFEAFLQSGMARLVVPVREGFEDAIDLYMETGDIWNGGDLVVDTDDDLYVSIAEELQEIEGKVGKEWQSRVPTSLTVIQSDSVALNATGLPCCDMIDHNLVQFNGTNDLLEAKETTT